MRKSEVIYHLPGKNFRIPVTREELLYVQWLKDLELAPGSICFLFHISDEELEQVLMERQQKKIEEVLDMLNSKPVWRIDNEPLPLKDHGFIREITGIPMTYKQLVSRLKKKNIGKVPLDKLHEFFYKDNTEVKTMKDEY